MRTWEIVVSGAQGLLPRTLLAGDFVFSCSLVLSRPGGCCHPRPRTPPVPRITRRLLRRQRDGAGVPVTLTKNAELDRLPVRAQDGFDFDKLERKSHQRGRGRNERLLRRRESGARSLCRRTLQGLRISLRCEAHETHKRHARKNPSPSEPAWSGKAIGCRSIRCAAVDGQIRNSLSVHVLFSILVDLCRPGIRGALEPNLPTH